MGFSVIFLNTSCILNRAHLKQNVVHTCRTSHSRFLSVWLFCLNDLHSSSALAAGVSLWRALMSSGADVKMLIRLQFLFIPKECCGVERSGLCVGHSTHLTHHVFMELRALCSCWNRDCASLFQGRETITQQPAEIFGTIVCFRFHREEAHTGVMVITVLP